MSKIVVSCRQRAALLCLALAVFHLHPSTVLAFDATAKLPPAAELIIAGGVHVDDLPAVSGQTFFSGSALRVAAASRSILTLGNHGRLELSAETMLKLDFSDDEVTGVLTGGRIRVFAPAGVTARLMTEDATVIGDSGERAIFSVERRSGGGTTVRVEAGEVEMSFGSRKQLVSTGQFLSTSGGSPILPDRGQFLSGGWGGGLLDGIGHAVDLLSVLLVGRSVAEMDDQETPFFGGCVTVLSPTNTPPAPCR
jgi:hypothetical protein